MPVTRLALTPVPSVCTMNTSGHSPLASAARPAPLKPVQHWAAPPPAGRTPISHPDGGTPAPAAADPDRGTGARRQRLHTRGHRRDARRDRLAQLERLIRGAVRGAGGTAVRADREVLERADAELRVRQRGLDARDDGRVE